jgi:hypothetical protein
MTATAKILDRIQKLRALAEGSTGNEAEVAAAMADRLMRKHAVSLIDLTEDQILRDDPLADEEISISRASWTAQLAWALGEHCRVSVLRTRTYRGGKRVTLARAWGHTSDLAVWSYLYEVARREIERAAKNWQREQQEGAWGWSPSRTEMTRFREGAVYGLREKLREQRRAAADAETAETGLVLQSREARAEAAMRGANPRVGTYRGGVGGSNAGYRAGGEINLNPAVGAQARAGRKLIGGGQ